MDFCDFKASLIYQSSFRPARATQKDLVSKTNKQTKSGNQTSDENAFIWPSKDSDTVVVEMAQWGRALALQAGGSAFPLLAPMRELA